MTLVHASRVKQGEHGDDAMSNVTDLNSNQAVIIILLFLVGWSITRFSNMQKFLYRTHPQQNKVFFGLIKQKTIPGTRILVSG